MKKYHVIVFGELPIATKITMFLEALGQVEIGVVIGNKTPHNNDPWGDIPLLTEYCEKRNIPTYTIDQINTLFGEGDLDLGLSCRFSVVLKRETIAKFKQGIINTHGGLLPEFRGVYSVNHTILKGSPVGGGTLHYIDENIDTGAIIRRCEFEVQPDDTAYTVHQKTQQTLEKNLEEIIPEALKGRLPCIDQDELTNKGVESSYYDKHSLEGQKEIKLDEMDCDEIIRRIRAFDFPGYEPAYIVDKNGRKVYLRYSI